MSAAIDAEVSCAESSFALLVAFKERTLSSASSESDALSKRRAGASIADSPQHEEEEELDLELQCPNLSPS